MIRSRTLKEGYEFYISEGGTLEYSIYRAICDDFNILVIERIIYHGETFYMGHGLSYLQIIRVETNFKRPKINWNKSLKRKEEIITEGKIPYSKENKDGIKWFVYFLGNEYCRFHWNKLYCTVPNKSVYSFNPTGGENGNKTKLIELLKGDDAAYLRFSKIKRKSDYDI